MITLLKVKYSILTILFVISKLAISQYCTPGVTGAVADCGITNFTFANLSHNSPDQEHYVDYTAFSATVYRSMTHNLSITTVNTAMQGWSMWIDWNQDGDFNDADETYIGGRFLGTINTTIPIPSAALVGSTRLRVASDFHGNTLDTCSTLQASGDIEDYTVIIRDTVICTATQYLSPQFTSPAVEKKVLGIEIFSSTNFNLSSLTFNTNGTSNLASISSAKVFYSGSNNYSFASNQFGVTVAAPSGVFIVNGAQVLQPGENYFWLTFDVGGTPGDIIDAQLQSIVVNATSYNPNVTSPPLQLTIKPAVCNYNAKRNNIWYFGDKAGIDFNAAPVALTNSAMTQNEGCASIADKNGNLLFYTHGDTVWDKNHNVMPNGFGIGGALSATQSSLILEQPDNDSIYYIFTVGQANDGFYYSVVDMSKNTGLGDVIVKHVLLVNNATEKLTAVMHSNKRDIWILCHDFNNNSHYAYLLTPTDVKDPVITTIGLMGPFFSGGDAIKVSPDGTKIASTFGHHNLVELFDFNTTSGVLSGLKTIDVNIGGYSFPYGVEFSPNSNLLYITHLVLQRLSQYDITLATGPLIAASEVALSNSFNVTGAGSLQLAPDGRIYCANRLSNDLGVINNPDVPGTGCGFVLNGFNLSGKVSLYGLPNQFIPAAPPVAVAGTSTSICRGESVTLTSSGGLNYSWTPSTGLSSVSTATVTASPVVTTTYTSIVSNTSSCLDSAYVVITVNNLPTLNISGDTTVCNGIATTLTASGANTYTWFPSPGLSNTTGTSISIMVTSGTTYTVTGIDGNGCKDTSTVNIAAGIVTVSVSGITAICSGSATTLTSGGSGATHYTWSPSLGLSSTTGTFVTISPTGNTSYTVTGTDALGCTSTSTFSITTTGLSVTLSAGNNSICEGSSTTLTATGGNSYIWLPAQGLGSSTGNLITINPTGNTTYTVIGSDGAGCNDTSYIAITVNLIPIANPGPNDTICEGQNAILNASGGSTYVWNTGATSSSITISPPITTSYSFTVSNGNCIDVDSAKVVVFSNPTASVSNNITIAAGQSTTLSATGGVSYQWSPALGLSCITCQNPVAAPQVTTKYYVTVTNANGCTTLDSITVTVDVLCKSFYIPNAFSPNNDGENDIFMIKGDCIKTMHLTICNRWGEKVFETDNIKNGWDGKYKGQQMNSDTFIYYLSADMDDRTTINKKGNIALLK